MKCSESICAITGNPCGTDTWMEPCKCEPCQEMLRWMQSVSLALKPIYGPDGKTQIGEIAAPVGE